MNRYTIVVDDKFVSVDGVGYNDVVISLDPSIHAVQWYGNYGEIEYGSVFDPVTKAITKPQNEVFEDASLFQAALDAWRVSDIQAKEARAASEVSVQAQANGGV